MSVKKTQKSKQTVDKEKQKRRNEILSIYAKLARKFKRHIRMNDLVDAGITKDTVTHHFRSLTRLSQAARAKYPKSFHDVAISELLGPKALSELQDTVKNHKKFVITTAVTSCVVDDSFLASIKNYCDRNDAALLVLMASDPAHNREFGKTYGSIDKKILDQGGILVSADTALNSNLYISTIKLSAKQIDPITSLGRIGQRNGSFIYASPKQRLKAVPMSNTKLPHFLMTTGAITKPNYATENYMSERTAYIADHDHVMGALVVEIQDKNIYHFRQIQADSRGSFIDFGTQYNKDGSTDTIIPSAFVLGDWHAGSVDPKARKCWQSVISQLCPEKLVVHDLFDALSINHHEMHKNVLRAQRANSNKLDLAKELKIVAADLDELSDDVDQIVVVKSNHDEFLERYLEDGAYVKDPYNHRISLELAMAMLDGNDPLRYGIEKAGLKNTDKIRWLERDEDCRIARIQLGAHGDQGANGSRGTLKSMEAAYGNSVTGHSHTPEILCGAYQVGTSSLLKLTYNQGPSSWLHTSCIIYPNGSRQLINAIGGECRLAV